jgi:hypothetical protein
MTLASDERQARLRLACALLLPREQQARGLRLRPLAGRNISRMDFAGPVDALSVVKRARSVETRLYSAENTLGAGFAAHRTACSASER